MLLVSILVSTHPRLLLIPIIPLLFLHIGFLSVILFTLNLPQLPLFVLEAVFYSSQSLVLLP